MSIRETRRELAAEARDEIKNAESQRERMDRTLRLLKVAASILQEEPKAETRCGLVLEYAQKSQWVDCGECTECGETYSGYRPSWRFCPCCGSTVVSVEKEDSPGDRLARNAVREAVAAMTGN
jgi:hypothetical protein